HRYGRLGSHSGCRRAAHCTDGNPCTGRNRPGSPAVGRSGRLCPGSHLSPATFGGQMRVPLRPLERWIRHSIPFGAALALAGCFTPPARVPAPGHVAARARDAAEHSSVIPVPETPTTAPAIRSSTL